MMRLLKDDVRALVISAVLFLFLFPFSAQAQSTSSGRIPKNIVLFIGDGMGVAHVTAAHIMKGSLNLDKFPNVGLLLTQSEDAFVTTSHASTTAVATGVLTKNDRLGLSPSGESLKTLLDYARDNHKATGIVVTSNLTDATPACFVSHLYDRSKEDQIAQDIVSKEVDVVMGSGIGRFLPTTDPRGQRSDNKDLLAELAKTHTIVTSPEEFKELGQPKKLAAFFNSRDLSAGASPLVSLPKMTAKALEVLSSYEEGFFLVIEGSQIDWASHYDDNEQMIKEIADLDDAAGVALEFAQKREDTLVIVTADHETGGYVLLNGSVPNKKISEALFMINLHTGVMVPLFAYGAGSEELHGIHKVSDIGQILVNYSQNKPGVTGQ